MYWRWKLKLILPSMISIIFHFLFHSVSFDVISCHFPSICVIPCYLLINKKEYILNLKIEVDITGQVLFLFLYFSWQSKWLCRDMTHQDVSMKYSLHQFMHQFWHTLPSTYARKHTRPQNYQTFICKGQKKVLLHE